MRKKSLSLRNPGIVLGIIIFVAWILCWIVFMVAIPNVMIAGLPLLTWSQIVLGAVAVIISGLAIMPLDKWERS
jgi:hypothetical protein